MTRGRRDDRLPRVRSGTPAPGGAAAPGAVGAPDAPSSPLDPAALRDALLDWFASNGRSLPGRDDRDPWHVLVVEVMSQQTQIDRSLAAAATFCAAFPTPSALAAASPGEVLRAWAGLGYNRRALALRAAARAMVERHGGRVPDDPASLLALPGVGPYTARAVAARAFGATVMPVDVNVRRVLGRVLDDPRPARVQALGDLLARSADGRPGAIADALMDLAAGTCRAREPACTACPLSAWCGWRASGATVAGRTEPGSVPRGSALPGSGSRRPALRAPGSPVSGPAGALPFPRTRRWLRGQLLRELREAPPGAWSTVEGPRGTHDHAAVRETIATLAREGFVELDEVGRARLAED